jgi:hypothetical protein
MVVFGKFSGGDLILKELGISMEIRGGFVVLLRSALLGHLIL